MRISCDDNIKIQLFYLFQNIVKVSLPSKFWKYHTIFNYEILAYFSLTRPCQRRRLTRWRNMSSAFTILTGMALSTSLSLWSSSTFYLVKHWICDCNGVLHYFLCQTELRKMCLARSSECLTWTATGQSLKKRCNVWWLTSLASFRSNTRTKTRQSSKCIYY